MAGKSAKKHAAYNTKFLNQSIYISIILIILSLLRVILTSSFSKSLYFKYIIIQSPLIICLFILNKTGRPKWINGDLQNEGSMINLTNPQGLVEYMLDLLYLAWFGNITITIFNSFKFIWFIWILVIPAFIIYKLIQLKNTYWKGNGINLPRQNKNKSKQPIENNEHTKSKRQLKRENRSNDKIKYRNR
ncbi:SRP-independent targeting protein 2 [Monosporozyma unispora]|nr:hypothetical protein C6P44_005296 [Kazachstania unispora]